MKIGLRGGFCLGLLAGLGASKQLAGGMAGLDGHTPKHRELEHFARNQVQANNFTDSDAVQRLRARRAAEVRKGFSNAWNAYKKHAFGADEINPLTLEPVTTRNGWGATLIDALDTLYIMGLDDEFKEATEK
ncbi:hypothetical protein LPJ61_003734, partial [Coemansia biformis]